MSEKVSFELSELPVKLKLFNVTKIKSFYDSPEGIKALKDNDNSKRNKIIAKIIIWVALIFSVYYLFTNGHPIWAILLALVGFGAAVGISAALVHTDFYLDQSKKNHCISVVKELINSYFSGATCFGYKTEALIYNNDICAFLSTATDELVIYKRQNIKEVYRERVLLGSSSTNYVTTTGKSSNTLANTMGVDPFKGRNYSGSTQVSTSTRSHYNWHFDILTDFLEHPKVTFIVPDDEYYENEIGKAYAILKP